MMVVTGREILGLEIDRLRKERDDLREQLRHKQQVFDHHHKADCEEIDKLKERLESLAEKVINPPIIMTADARAEVAVAVAKERLAANRGENIALIVGAFIGAMFGCLVGWALL